MTDGAQVERARVRLRAGGLAALALGGVLWATTTLPFVHLLGLPFFLVLLPALAAAQAPILVLEELRRAQVYLSSALSIGVLGALGLLLALPSMGADGMGLRPVAPGTAVVWTVGMTGAGLLLVALLTRVGTDRAGPHEELLLRLLPRTAGERVGFAGLSLAAGVGEELAFRGYLLHALLLLPLPGGGVFAAVVISSAAFGAVHAYQGPGGILRTAGAGVVFATGTLATGSLLPAILAHVLVDLVAGLLLGPGLLRRAAASAPPLDPPEG